MSLNIIDLIKGQLGPALVSQAATQLGESESGVSKAISGLLPAIVGGFANNADNSSVLDAIKGAASSGILSNLLGGSSNNPIISSVLSSIFGDKVGSIVNSVSNFAGVSESSSSSLLNLVTGATLGSVGKYAADNNLDASGVSSLLSEQKSGLSSLLPAGLSFGALGLGSLFGNITDTAKDVLSGTASAVEGGAEKVADTAKDLVGGAASLAGDATEKVADTAKDVAGAAGAAVTGAADKVSGAFKNDDNGGSSIWKWLLPLLLLLLAGWFLWKQFGDKKGMPNETPMTTDSTAVIEDSTNIVANSTRSVTATKESTTVTLPNGTSLDAYKGGIEDQVVTFLNSDEYKNATEDQLKDKWFNFDNLNFEFGTAKLTPESQKQLDNLKAILVAYPDAKIKIGAYSDKKGDDAGNLKLSQQRADAVKAALNTAQVTEAEGYGEKFAKVDENASDEEREADRKTAIRFVK